MKLYKSMQKTTISNSFLLLQTLFIAMISLLTLPHSIPLNTSQIIATKPQIMPTRTIRVKSVALINALATPTVDATVTALKKEKLGNENNWFWSFGATIASTLALIIAGVFGIFRYLSDRRRERETQREAEKRILEDRQAEREKRDEEQKRWLEDRKTERERRAEERFQSIVESLGNANLATQVGAAILLRTFLLPGYEQFYSQAFDLAVANLRIHHLDPNSLISLDSLQQALVTVFKESFPLARDWLKLTPQTLDASHIQLDNAYLSAADLKEAWMQEANLRKAALNKANLSQTNLRFADLTGADLTGTDLSYTDLSEANLTGADLSEANLTGADLSEANLTGARLYNADFTKANLSEANLIEASLNNTNLHEANLSRTNFNRAHFDLINLSGANLSWTSLEKANLSKVKLSGADLTNTDLSGADLSGADLTDADLSGADLSGADLTDADLTKAKLCRANLNRAKFNNANLSGTELSEADFKGFDPTIVTSLKGAIMNNIKGLTQEQLDACAIKGAIIK